MDDQERTREPANGGYHVDEIRDFFRQLLLELRLVHRDATIAVKRGPCGSDLSDCEPTESVAEELQALQDKYRCCLLPAEDLIVPRDMPKSQVDDAFRRLAKQSEGKREEQLRRLESLRELLNESLSCAEAGGKTARQVWVRPAE